MPTEGKVQVSNFVGGMVTDFHELNQPPNTTVDEDNCDLDRKGSRKRRLGIDFEEGYSLSSTTWSTGTFDDLYVGTSVWEAVNNDGNRNFLIVQIGSTLYYYDLAINPVSAGLMPFTTNLVLHRFGSDVSAATVASSGISVASGKGVIFICGEVLTPFYVTYDEVTGTITETKLFLSVRDFHQQSTVTDYEDEPTSIDYTLRYDYYNQGWYKSDIYFAHEGGDTLITDSVLDQYFLQYAKYPPLSKVWWLGNQAPDGDKHNHINFNIASYKNPYIGNLRAPLGHYIVNPFKVNRSGVSGIAGFAEQDSPDRPTALAFYAGKVFYGWKNQIMFSQTLIEDFGVASKCCQQADPTAETINNLVATDGGVIPLQYSGQIVAMMPFENSLIIFCTNGIWALGGTSVGAGFSAEGYALYKISSFGAIGPRSVIDTDGTPVWWAKSGIYTLRSVPGKQGFGVENLCKDKVQLFYDAIPGVSKLYASGTYDRLKKTIVWVYNSTDTPIDGNPYFCNRVLNYDTLLGAFFPYTLSDLPDLTPRVADVFALLDVSTTTETVDVVDALGAIVTNSLGAAVTIEEQVLGNFDNQNNIGVKYLTLAKEIVSG